MGKRITFPRTSGGTAEGYLAEAADAKAPGVVVVQEWWGVQGQIQSVCDRFADAGFTALAPDLFGGRVIPYHDVAAAQAAMASLDFKVATDEVVRGAVRFLKARGTKAGITGFCMGGAVTVVAAVHVPELDAAVDFYGLAPESVAPPKDVRVPIQGHFASEDDWNTPAAVDEFERKLQAAKKTCEIYRYQGTHHAFMNTDRKEVYSPRAAKLAWDRAVSFLERYLAG